MKKKLLFMMLLLCAVVQGAWADKWDGKTTKRPAEYGVAPNFIFFIREAAELAYIQQNWEVRDCYGLPGNYGYCYKYTYYLDDDFDMTAVNWKPFGHAFEGKFYGKGHTIKIKNDSYTSSNCQGLFAEIGENGLVEDLRVEVDFNFNNSRKVGGIAGDNYGTIKDCWVTGTITTNHYHSSKDADLGGIAGLNESDGKIQYCCFDGTVTNTDNNTGVGGLVGRSKGTLEHCTFIGKVGTTRNQDNIFVGVKKKDNTNCYTVFSQSEYDAAGTDNDLYRDAIKQPAENFTINSEADWKAFASYVNHGYTFSGKTVTLGENITVTVVNEKIWTPTSSEPKVDDPTLKPFAGSGCLSSFQGTFDGGGHTITFNVDKRNYKDLRVKGLAPFRWVCGATIKNLKVAGTFNNREGDYTSALVGNAFGSGNKIEDCVVEALVAGNSAAGFVGCLHGGDIALDGCVMTGVVHSIDRSAFIGWGNCDKQEVTNCLYIRQSIQDNDNLDLVKNNATLEMSNTYKTTPAGSKGTPADMYVTEPKELGSVKKEYSHLTVYEQGAKYDGKWYKAATEFGGDGTAESPYIISSTEEWERFAYRVNQGNNYFDQHLKLTSDISVTTVVGTAENTFRGTFDGGGKTLTIDDYTGGDYTAPFSYTTDATIKNLTVGGTINAEGKYAGGIVGSAYGKLTLDGCRSSVAIKSSVSGEAWHGGLVGYGANYNELSIESCVFDGSFSTTTSSTHCGGLIGFKEGIAEYSTYTINNSFVKPESVAEGMVSGSFIGSLREDGEYPITNSYFVNTGNLPANQGIQAYSSVPAGNISRQVTFTGEKETYYVPCTVEANQLYQFTGSSITVDNPTVKAYDGTTLTANTDYTYTTDPAEVIGEGTYDLVVSGIGNYSGSVTIPFLVAGNASINEYLTTGEYTVHNTLTINDRIPIQGDVVINILKDVTLTAAKGFELPEGSSLTINGPGALSIQSCDDNNAGIGGATMGTLTINSGQVTVTGGTGAPGIGPNTGTGGNLTLSWRNAEDFIKCNNYAVASTTFDKKFMLDGKSAEAEASNINGVKIVPYGKTGTVTNPILIDDISDWNFFVRTVNEGNDYSGKYVKLAIDLKDVTKMAGAWSDNERYRRPFCGTFDGGGHTITVDIQNYFQTGVALFNYVKNATIKNLNVAGKITGHRHSASLVGYADGTTSELGNTIENCTSKVTITGPRSVSGYNYTGGLVGNALNSKITITGCVYSGLMLNAAQGRGAILGWGENSGQITLDNCLYLMPEEQSTTNLDLARKQGGSLTVNANCYKTTDAGTYGTQVDTKAAVGEISKKVTAADSKDYYIPCTVSGVVDYYKWTESSNIAITIPTVTARDETVLKSETDFTCTTDPGTVNAEGNYTLTLSGKGNYTGSKSFVFAVGKDAPVTSKTTELTSGTYKVYHYLVNNNRINISGNVTLVLAEGATLYAPKGIELGYGNTLTIEGPGALVVNDCDEGKSGIGAESMGTLTINGGQLDIQGAEGAGGIGADAGKDASGSLTISSSNLSDYVKCSSYAVRSSSFNLNGGFVIKDEQTIATKDIIGGKTIVPAMVLDDQGGSNTTELKIYDGKQLAVALDGRTIYLDGKWNTLCLPFDYDISELRNVEARTLTAASIKGTTLNLTFGNAVDEVKAGVPYIIKVAKEEGYENNATWNLVDPVFEDVTVKNELNNFGSGDAQVSFIGTYSSQKFGPDDNNILLMGGENKLYYAADGTSIGACRAYFKIAGGTGAPRIDGFNISFDGDDSTLGVTTPLSDRREAGDEAWYSLDGRRLQGKPAQKGVYINNGRKIVIK